jgi:hypothetical protein
MKTFKGLFPYLLTTSLAFFVLPFSYYVAGFPMWLIWVELPSIVFVVSLFYGLKQGFHVCYAVFVCFVFIVTINIFYDSSAWYDVIAHFLLTCAGMGLGNISYRRKVY